MNMVNFKSLVPWKNNKSQVPAPREDFFDPLVAFRREMDRVFDDFFSGFNRAPLFRWQGATPSMDLAETDKEIVIKAELPGLDEKDFEVTVSGDLLTLQGEKN